MEKILEFFREKNIDYLKLGLVSFEEKENKLNLNFLYDEKNFDLIGEQKDNLISLAKNYVGIKDISYNIRFVKAFLDEDRTKLVIKEYLKKFYVAFYYALKKIDVKILDNNIDIKIDFSLDGNVDNIEKILLDFLNSKYFYNFSVKCNKVEETFDNLQEHKLKVMNEISEPILINKMRVNKVENIIGEINEFCCYPYEYYKNAEENIFLCGKLLKIEQLEFTKKDGETKGIRYVLTLKCLDTTYSASLFPTKKNLEIVQKIESGIDVIMQGNLDNFNNSLSFKVKNLARCEICDYERAKPIINKEYADYKIVFPQKYDEVSQASLFEERHSNKHLDENEFVVFDLETTGLDFMNSGITEIGAVKIKNGSIVETFSTFVNPKFAISDEITKLTGITEQMVKDAPTIDEVMCDFYKFCKGAILVGQNIEFDYGFINFYGKKSNYIFDNLREDTMLIAKKNIFLKNYKLKTIAEALKVPLINAHRAINDAMCTAKVYIKLAQNFL